MRVPVIDGSDHERDQRRYEYRPLTHLDQGRATITFGC